MRYYMQQKVRCKSGKKKPGTKVGQGSFKIDRSRHGSAVQSCCHSEKGHSESENAHCQECFGTCLEKSRAPLEPKAGCLALPAVLIIKFYQNAISPLFPPCCRFTPTCSSYGISALRIHGFFKGSLLIAWRILRCNPFSKGGYDPVPPKGAWRPLNPNKEL